MPKLLVTYGMRLEGYLQQGGKCDEQITNVGSIHAQQGDGLEVHTPMHFGPSACCIFLIRGAIHIIKLLLRYFRTLDEFKTKQALFGNVNNRASSVLI